MIKAIRGNQIILGLSDENIKRLRAGQPIVFNLKDMGLPPYEVVIFHGKTEHDMKTDLFKAGLIDPEKTIIKDAKAKDN